MDVIKCTCGKKTKYKMSGGYNVSAMAKKTGWNFVGTHSEGGLNWVCPSCYKKLVELAEQIYKILPDPNLYFYGLVAHLDNGDRG